MKFVRESKVYTEQFEEPYKRKIAHLISPWEVGSKNVWVGICTYPSGFSSNPHFHDSQEEIFYCISGCGKIIVNNITYEVSAGDAVYVEPGETHQCINDKEDQDFKLLSVVVPPFSKDSFSQVHSSNE